MSTEGSDVPASDPNYIMQLVSDVRKFADVLLQLKDVFNSKGILSTCTFIMRLCKCVLNAHELYLHSYTPVAVRCEPSRLFETNAPLLLRDND